MHHLVYRLHTASLAVLGIACFACTVVVPQPPKLTIAMNAKARPQTAPVNVQVEANIEVQASAETYVQSEGAPPSYTAPVALEGAAIVEFFGIPLEGAQDIVFVLDRSGSMEELAQGQIAQLGNPQAMPPEPQAAPPEITQPAPPEVQAPLPMPPPVQDYPQAQSSPPWQSPRKIDVAHAELVDALQRLPAGTRINILFFNNSLEAIQASIAPMQEGDRENLVGFVRETFPYGPTALAPAMRTAFLMNARHIILLSDGLGNVGGDADAVMRDAREAMRGGVRIDTIGLGQDQDAWLLGKLARESGGIYQRL